MWHEGFWLLAFNIKRPFRKHCKQPRHLSIYFLRFVFCKKRNAFYTYFFLWAWTRNFAGELLEKFQLFYRTLTVLILGTALLLCSFISRRSVCIKKKFWSDKINASLTVMINYDYLLHPVSHHESVTFHFTKSGQTSFTKLSFCKFKDMDITFFIQKIDRRRAESCSWSVLILWIRSLFNKMNSFSNDLLVSSWGHFYNLCP